MLAASGRRRALNNYDQELIGTRPFFHVVIRIHCVFACSGNEVGHFEETFLFSLVYVVKYRIRVLIFAFLFLTIRLLSGESQFSSKFSEG
jgi:hypothetical protein